MMGAGRYLKEKKPSIQLVAVEPEKGHKIQGLKNTKESIVPTVYDRSLVDRVIVVLTKDAYEWTLKLAREEGLFVGQSSGAAMYGAYQVASKLDEGFVVVVLPDFGFKYLTVDPYYDEEVVTKVLEARKTGCTVEV